MKNVKVVILCGGRGMRLYRETDYRPKPMIEIGGKPILWHIMKIYSHYGYRDFVLCTGYKGEMIKNYFLNFEVLNSDFTVELGKAKRIELHNPPSDANWRVTIADTGLDVMTGARVKRIEKYIEGDLFMLTYGDGVADININKLVEFHLAHGKMGTVTGVHSPSRFGELVVNGELVKEFSEKPQVKKGYINGGFFVFNKGIFKYVTDEDSCILEGKPLENLAKNGELAVFPHEGYWQCMDTYRDLQALNRQWESGKVPWKVLQG
jgi:glucose-1-phosphate cytidylyltransferase